MVEALAQGANPNWSNPEDEGKTPLIKATESVRHTLILFLFFTGISCHTFGHVSVSVSVYIEAPCRRG